MIFASILSVAASVSYLFVTKAEHLMVIRAVEGVAWAGFMPTVEASSADISSEMKHGRAMGLLAALYGAGFALGCLVSGSIVEASGYRTAFLFYSLASFVGLTFVVVQGSRSSIHTASTVQSIVGETIERGVEHTLFYACLLSAVYSAVLATVLFLFPVYVKDLGFNVFSVGAVLALFWVSRIVSFLTRTSLG